MVMEILLWIGFSQSLFSAILFLLVKKEKSLSNHFLAAWLFIFAFEFLTTAIGLTRGSFHLTNPFLIFNPLLYFYSKSLINPGLRLKWYQLWHILPYLFIKFGAYMNATQLEYSNFFTINSETWFNFVFGILSVFSFIGYSTASLMMVHRYRLNLKNEFSTINRKVTLGWLLFVIIFYMTFMGLAYVLGLIKYISRIETFAVIVTYSFILGLVYVFSFYGLLQQQLYTQTVEAGSKQYKNPRLTGNTIQEEIKKLSAFFNEEKPYLDSEFTIYKLSESLNLARHELTEVLNTGIGKNFYQFVNEYRVEEVKQKLKNPKYDKYSIDAIGFECGFNSKSTFYEVFKKYTGFSPAQYKSSLKQ